MQKARVRIDERELPHRGDTTVAFKIIALLKGLTATDKRVLAAVLDHFNQKNGQCDPSIETIAALLNVDRSAVMRTFTRAEKLGIFRKVRHGGHLNRNSYQPMWDRFREIDQQWQEQRSLRSARRRGASLSPSTSSSGHLLGGSAATQTCQTNLSKETWGSGRPKEGDSNQSHASQAGVRWQSTPSSVAMRSGAERRWSNDLLERYAGLPMTYGEIVEAIDNALREAATDAELRHRGAGVLCIENALGILSVKPNPPPSENGGGYGGLKGEGG